MARFTTEQVERQEMLFNAKKGEINISDFIDLKEFEKSLIQAMHDVAIAICNHIGIKHAMYIPSKLKEGINLLYVEYFERLVVEEYLKILGGNDTNDIRANDGVEAAEKYNDIKNRKSSLRNQIKEAFPNIDDTHFHTYSSDLYLLYSVDIDEWLKSNYEYYSSIVLSIGDVKDSDWFGKRFFDIPFAAMCENPRYIAAIVCNEV